MNGVPTVDRFHIGDRPSSATLDDGYGLYDGRAPTILNPGETCYPHLAVTEPHPLLDGTQPTPTISRMADDLGYIDPSGPLPVGRTGKQGKMQLSAGSPPVGPESVESKRPNKRKRTTAPHERREIRRTRQRRSQRLGQGESNQVGIMRFRPVQKPPITTPILASPFHYSALAL